MQIQDGGGVSVRFRRGSRDIDFQLVDPALLAVFKLNVKFMDPEAVAAAAVQKGKDPWTADDLKSVMVPNAGFVVPELDGPAVECALCGSKGEPQRVPLRVKNGSNGELSGEFGGAFLVYNADKLAGVRNAMVSKPEVLARFERVLNETSEALVKKAGIEMPARARAFPFCLACRNFRQEEGFVERYYDRAGAMAVLPVVDGKIEAAVQERQVLQNQADLSNALGGFRRQQSHYSHSGPSRGDHRNGGYRQGRERPNTNKTFINWEGASLEAATVAAIQAAQREGKLPADNKTALEFMTSNDGGASLLSLGLAHVGSLKPILFQLRKALGQGLGGQPSQPVGEATPIRNSEWHQQMAPGARPQPRVEKMTRARARRAGAGVNIDDAR